VRERLEIRDVRESLEILPAVTSWWLTWVAGSLNRQERGRESEALGGGGRVYREGRRDIRDLAGKVKEGARAGD
jgi:hypothetical protein